MGQNRRRQLRKCVTDRFWRLDVLLSRPIPHPHVYQRPFQFLRRAHVFPVSELHGHQGPLRPVPRTERRLQSRRRQRRRVSRKRQRISSTSSAAERICAERRSVHHDQQRGRVLLPDRQPDCRSVLHDILPRRDHPPKRVARLSVHRLACYDPVCPDADRRPRNRRQQRGTCLCLVHEHILAVVVLTAHGVA